MLLATDSEERKTFAAIATAWGVAADPVVLESTATPSDPRFNNEMPVGECRTILKTKEATAGFVDLCRKQQGVQPIPVQQRGSLWKCIQQLFHHRD